jgi:hypothetical protein
VLTLGIVSFFTAGCDKLAAPARTRPPSAFPVTVVTRESGQQPLAGVRLFRGKTEVGTSDANGYVTLDLKGAEGSTVSLSVRCPEDFASPEKPITVGLRKMTAGSPRPLFDAECVPVSRSIVVGVRAENGPNLPIVRLNRTIGRTDAFGFAHLLVQAAPEEQVTLTLDTSANSALKPASPALTFVAQDRNEMVLLDHKFTIVRPAVRNAKPKPNVPQRL